MKKEYYIQGDPARAEEIKAAFERLGYYVKNWLFTTGVYYTLNGRIVNTKIFSNEYELILNSSDYKELKLPKTHYDISNFYAGMPVLVRADNNCRWDYSIFSRITGNEDWKFAVCNGVNVAQCIPFEGNEHLLGTTDMCAEEFINW